MTTHSDLKQLWELARRLASELEEEPEGVFDPIGLILEEEPFYYDVTPKNAIPFAHTGGDGDHFSLLCIDGYVAKESPVIMTIPTNFDGHPNIILGENLLDFLSLGCETGYFEMFGFSERLEEYCKRVEKGSVQFDAKQQYLLKRLNDAFQLEPWSNVRSKFTELQVKYGRDLIVELEV